MDNLYGHKGKFAIGLQFRCDPDTEYPVEPFLGNTWGSLQIWADGINLCSRIDDGQIFESVDWYFLNLFEWFIENWNPLFHEQRLPNKNTGSSAWHSLHLTEIPPPALEANEEELNKWESWWQDWWFRHSIISARDGGLFPDIVIRRCRDMVEISWGRSNLPGAPEHFRFINDEPNFKLLRPQSVAEPIYQLLTDAARHLSEKLPCADRVKAFSKNVKKLQACGSDGCDLRKQRIAWLAGLGRTASEVTAVWERTERAIRSEKNSAVGTEKILETVGTPIVITGSCHAALMFGSMAPEIVEGDAIKLAHEMIRLHDPEYSGSVLFDEMRSKLCEEVEQFVEPWEQGCKLACIFHELNGTEFEQCKSVEIEEIIDSLGIFVGDLDLSDAGIKGVSIAGLSFRPAIFLNPKNDFNNGHAGRRFSLAHELCHHLVDAEIGRPLALASGPWTPRSVEQRANAFAAEILIPDCLIHHDHTGQNADFSSFDGIIELSKEINVGKIALIKHLENKGIITGDAVNLFLDQLSEEFDASHYDAPDVDKLASGC